VDVIPEKVEKLNNKVSPIQDDYIEKYLAEKPLDLVATLDGRLAYADADFVVIAAPTNYDPVKNYFDTSRVEEVIDLVLEVNPDAVMVIKSTIPVGYTRNLYVKYAQKGEKVAILGLGAFYGLGESVAKLLKEECGVEATLINPRYITGLDVEMLEELKRSHSLVVTLEDGELDGGFGEKIARFYGSSDVKVLNYGVRKEFADRYITEELLKANRLTDVQIVEDIRKYW
jgi:deoxyxylulose-5-phosphate synthase